MYNKLGYICDVNCWRICAHWCSRINCWTCVILIEIIFSKHSAYISKKSPNRISPTWREANHLPLYIPFPHTQNYFASRSFTPAFFTATRCARHPSALCTRPPTRATHLLPVHVLFMATTWYSCWGMIELHRDRSFGTISRIFRFNTILPVNAIL